MAVAVTRDGETIRVEWLWKWYLRLPSLPFLAGSLYFLWYAVLIVRADVSGQGRWSDDWVGLLFCIGFALFVGTPGIILATLRYFIELDKLLRQIIVTRQFGPLKIRSQRQFSDFKLISIVDDSDEDSTLTMYDVNLCGGKGVTPILVSSFTRREEANEFACELGEAFKLPPRDFVGTPVDDPD
jgi:hypothetical protein